jgi:hypothetical protein
MSLLPGEDPAEFEKLHKALVAEYAPTGQHEHEIVETIARLMWRKRCLWSYGLAELARKRYSAIELEREKANDTRSDEIWTKKDEHDEKVDNALEQYRAEKDAKGSRYRMRRCKGSKLSMQIPISQLKRSTMNFGLSSSRIQSLESTRHSSKSRKNKFDEKWAMLRLS